MTGTQSALSQSVINLMLGVYTDSGVFCSAIIELIHTDVFAGIVRALRVR